MTEAEYFIAVNARLDALEAAQKEEPKPEKHWKDQITWSCGTEGCYGSVSGINMPCSNCGG
jgi:hypothetical protein